VTSANNYGGVTQNWNGVDVLFNARFGHGASLQGGFSTGREFLDGCAAAQKAPSILLNLYTAVGSATAAGPAIPMQYCSWTQAWQNQFKALGAYVIPKIDVQLSGSFQGVPGTERVASYPIPNAVVAPLLGRSLAGGAANTTIQLLP